MPLHHTTRVPSTIFNHLISLKEEKPIMSKRKLKKKKKKNEKCEENEKNGWVFIGKVRGDELQN